MWSSSRVTFPLLGLLAAMALAGSLWVRGTPASSPRPPTVSGAATRVVSVNITSDEILLALAPTKLLAVSSLAVDPGISNVVSTAVAVPVKMKADVEQLLLLNADLVVLGAHHVRVVRQIEEVGLPVVLISGFESLEWVRTLIRTLGQAIGEAVKAEELIATMDARLRNVGHHVGSRLRPRVLYYSSGGFTGGSGTLFDEVVQAAGGENVAARVGVHGWKRLSLEQAVLADPDVIILSDSKWRTTEFEAEFLTHPAFRDTRAVRKGRVYMLPSRLMTTASHHVAETVEALAQHLHPEAFQE